MSELRLHGTLTRKLAPLVPRRHAGPVAFPGVVEPERRARGDALRRELESDRIEVAGSPTGTTFRVSV
ncbi:hypothetical protein [Sorangium sp. So ce1389]|uniref:hypothetical protein n=1 Tax=Sorangium sp. So ce1389 TaxID=3133336 RepID=UPI003F5FEFED